MIPDLRKLYDSRFDVCRDPTQPREEGPWQWYIRGRRANIVPWGPGLLAACFHDEKYLKTVRKMYSLPWVDKKASQHGSDEVNVVFQASRFEDAIPFVKPYSPRV